jgi:hypothetical protein
MFFYVKGVGVDIKGVVHAEKAFSKAHNFLFLHNNLIKISGIVVCNLWNTFYF